MNQTSIRRISIEHLACMFRCMYGNATEADKNQVETWELLSLEFRPFFGDFLTANQAKFQLFEEESA